MFLSVRKSPNMHGQCCAFLPAEKEDVSFPAVSPVIFLWTGVRTVILDYPGISFVTFTFLNRCVSATSLPALEPSVLVTVLVVALSIGTPYVSVNIMLNVTDWKGTYRLCYVNLVLWRLHLSCHNPVPCAECPDSFLASQHKPERVDACHHLIYPYVQGVACHANFTRQYSLAIFLLCSEVFGAPKWVS